ncbi:PAS domain-containing protein [Pedobacter sp. MC2016-14]|uniref:PAS domain-containing protein n=1 Tax=Pedobacter sp. MC2016-14 TaxID=2897327 RepID=UPI001E5BBDDB|nr:PAS domain-containing protein [Pedobacter sp. MC2016-14]MCD0486779.1 PAS domain-containing protein [Pedobacter sp. MC2016-14]
MNRAAGEATGDNNEHDRIQALHGYDILDTLPENDFDNLSKLAALICNTPGAHIILIDEERAWLKSVVGPAATVREIPRATVTFCEYSLKGEGVFEVQDTLLDERFSSLSTVVSYPFVRFYAGAPIVDDNGFKLGVICVYGAEPQILTAAQKEGLQTVAMEVMTHISLKKTVLDLKAKSKRFEEMSFVASKVNNAIVINDANNRVTWVNAAFEKITGFTLDDLAGKRLGDLITGPDTDLDLLEKAREQINSNQSFTVDLLAYRKDKKPIWLSIYNTMILDDDGNTEAEVEIILDITAKKQNEEQLQILSLVASKTNNGVNICDRDGYTTWVNQSLELLTGYSFEELQGKQIGDLLSANDAGLQLALESRKKSLNKQSFSIEVEVVKKDGTPLWLSVTNTPIVNDKGQVERQIDLIVDITERKQVEREMLEAKEQALQLSEAKEMFLSVMSHEIRTPLNAVLGMTYLLLDNDPKPSQIDDLNILKFSSENLLSIINDILDFTKIETGNLVLESRAFDLKTLANDIITSLQVNVKKNSNVLRLKLDERLPDQVVGDRTRLYQILMNLLGNAIKFTENGKIELHIRLEEESAEHVALYFEVSDTGIGIPEDKLSYVFESFTQAKTDISRQYGGTGLGLAITKKLLKLYQSEINVQSEEGKGSVFSFVIAFKKTDVLAAHNQLAEQPDAFLGKRILVVDDNEINILIAKRILGKWGLITESAATGYEAINKIKTEQYDLVFMDIKMPGIDGFEATMIIRELSGSYFKSLPVIALTASTLHSDEHKFKEAGMNGHILKPFHPEEIKKQLLEYLKA